MKNQPTADQNFVRKVNTVTVLDCLRREAPLSRAGVSARTGLNRSTVSSIVDQLIESGLVEETSLQDGLVGRPGMLLRLNPHGGAAVGLEIGVDFLSVVLTDFLAGLLWRRRIPIESEVGQGEIIEQASLLVEEAIQQAGIRGIIPLGLGVGLPGLVDSRQGRLVLAPNLHWSDLEIGGVFSARFDLPVSVENEANFAALGEYYLGAARGRQDFIYLSTGVGLGGGIMIGGRLYKGAGGFAGEIGHMKLYPQGELCACGGRGCWETWAGPRAVVRYACQASEGEPNFNLLTMEDVVRSADLGNQAALNALREVAGHLGLGIANLINVFNPELVVLGGTLSQAAPYILNGIRLTVSTHALKPLGDSIEIAPSSLGLDSCAFGAAARVLDDVIHEPLAPYSAYSNHLFSQNGGLHV